MPSKKPKQRKPKADNSYTINDKFFGELKIKHTANAWWKDRTKVGQLILAYKMDCKPHEVLVVAGLSRNQLNYFRKEHEEFSTVLEVMRRVPNVKARKTIIAAIDNGDVATARWYAERKMSDEFKEKKEIDVGDRPVLIDDM